MCVTGGISTNLQRHDWLLGTVAMIVNWFWLLKTVQAGAATSVYAAVSSDLDGQSGAVAHCVHFESPTLAEIRGKVRQNPAAV